MLKIQFFLTYHPENVPSLLPSPPTISQIHWLCTTFHVFLCLTIFSKRQQEVMAEYEKFPQESAL